MYVAITRARERLYLSLAQTRMLHGQTRYNLRSRFLEELPEGALKWLTPKVQSAAGGFSEGWGAVWEGSSRSSAPSGRGGASRWRDRAEPDRASALGVTADRDTDLGRADQASVRAAARFERGVAWRIGQTVSHARFGEGVIVSIEGQGSDARAQINFGRDGLKWLALSVARLEAAG
jgi:DNA helicase-2/ATP-dependent DNA helicase PcrA